MPLTRITVPAHLALPRVRALADAAHDALVQTCKVPVQDRFQVIFRLTAEAMIIDPSFPNVCRTSEASIVEITFLEGRSAGQKRKLYRHLVALAAAAGFTPDDIVIALTENTPIDWSLGRGQAYADLGDGGETS